MKDPFFLQPIHWLQQVAQPFADYFSLPTLPLHVHEVAFGCLLYSVIYYPISPILSRLVFPRHYPQLSRSRRLSWDAHVVSLVQSLLINGLALWVMAVDEERKAMTWEERVWGYTGASGMIQGLAAGYFLWDLVVTSRNLDVHGLGALAHAISALLVFSLGFRPFLNYYGCIFILWELSTPFLNIHWFLDKLNMTGSSMQLYNGILLITTFFSCRLVYGTYQSFAVFSDVWPAMGINPAPLRNTTEELKFASEDNAVPEWLAISYLASNTVLNSLNMYWFVKMIQAVAKRFSPEAKKKQEAEAIETKADGTPTTTGIRPIWSEVRRRDSALAAKVKGDDAEGISNLL